jgi:hypothetical protein
MGVRRKRREERDGGTRKGEAKGGRKEGREH